MLDKAEYDKRVQELKALRDKLETVRDDTRLDAGICDIFGAVTKREAELLAQGITFTLHNLTV